MAGCCDKSSELEQTAQKHRSVLWTVLIINAVMFAVEISFGLLADSVALIADSLDMLGDAVTYGSSIAVVGLGAMQKAKIAKLKAWIMITFGVLVSVRCVYQLFFPETPEFGLMFAVGAVALLANLVCLYLLSKFKEDDINMKSVWICSRNDIIANTSVLVAAVVVFATGSYIPDLLVGLGITFLFVRSALGIFKEANAVS